MGADKDSNGGDPASHGDMTVYESPDGEVKLTVRMHEDTVWLTQQGMAELFATSQQNVSHHIISIYEEGELEQEATHKKYLSVRQEGSREVRRELDHYNLDMILSVGYRVKSAVATRFRIWATQRLREYLVKGFTMDDDRLKGEGGGRYFEELLDRIRDIRSSEKVFWRKVLDIYATSADYDPNTDESREFFKRVQNKMHWAAHGHTAAELIFARADAEQPNMGITNFPGSRLIKRDVEVAKNYLKEDELSLLNRMVTAYLEMAELQAMNRNPMRMRDWIERLDQFLTMTGRELLDHAGTVSHEAAKQKAHEEYAVLRARRLEEPSDVEKHFAEAEKAMKRLEDGESNGDT